MLMHRVFSDVGHPAVALERGLTSRAVSPEITAFATTSEPSDPYTALIAVTALDELLTDARATVSDAFGRIARVVKSLKSPPIHLPRLWSEFHYKNLVTFFALPKSNASFRWIVDTNSDLRCARFAQLTKSAKQVELSAYQPLPWPSGIGALTEWYSELRASKPPKPDYERLVQEVDLQIIGSGSVARNRTFEAWLEYLTPDQKKVLDAPNNSSLRIIGPAGSGKTLALCLKAISVSRDQATSQQAKNLLIVTHSWAMAERVNGILDALAGGHVPHDITVLPLLYILQLHSSQGGRQSVEVIGDDSKDGRIASIELIQDILSSEGLKSRSNANMSGWFSEALAATTDGRIRADLALNLYDEFTGVLAAEGLAVDDPESIKKYVSAKREDWMPPFKTVGDRKTVVQIYRVFLSKLSDRGAITTDQFVSDAIRVLETFTWRTRRETEGYDFIFVDELQLFDSQERLALELLGRSRTGVPFITAEDPSQGMFAPLHRRQAGAGVDTSVYLDAVHRFDRGIFELIKFIYQKFPLNTIPLRIDPKKPGERARPTLFLCDDDDSALTCAGQRVSTAAASVKGHKRICVVTLGDVDDKLSALLEHLGVPVVQLRGFDDIEQLAYRKKSVIVAPWQFVGGTQFSNVIVVGAGTESVSTGFGRLRELTAIYLACSRAAESLEVICGFHVPDVLQAAVTAQLLEESQYSAPTE